MIGDDNEIDLQEFEALVEEVLKHVDEKIKLQ